MSEENTQGLEASVDQAANQEAAKEYTPTQLKAIEQGWKPKDQYEGPEEDFIDAPEFVRRGELFTKIAAQNNELKAVKRALEEFKRDQSKAKAADLDRNMKHLKHAQRQAMLEGEPEKAFQYEDQLEYVRAEKERVEREAAQPVAQQLNPEFVAWEAQNKWYTNDDVMRGAADALGFKLAEQGMAPGDVLKQVAATIRKEFAHKFPTPKAERPNAVAGTSRGGATRQESNDGLDADELRIMRKAVDSGAITEAEWKKQYKAVKAAS